MNEVESGTQRAVAGARSGASAARFWFTELGQGAWLLTIGVLVLGAFVLSYVMGRGAEGACDKALDSVQNIRSFDGNQSLQPDAVDELHTDAQALDELVSETTGGQRQAMQALADVAQQARADHAFHAHAALGDYHSVCF